MISTNRVYWLAACITVQVIVWLEISLADKASEEPKWVELADIRLPNGWFDMVQSLEMTMIDSFSVTNVSLQDAVMHVSEVYKKTTGVPFGSSIGIVGDIEMPKVTFFTNQTSAMGILMELAKRSGFNLNVGSAIGFSNEEWGPRLYRAVPTEIGRSVFRVLPPRFCEYGPRKQLVFLKERNIIIYRDKPEVGRSVMEAFRSAGLVSNIAERADDAGP